MKALRADVCVIGAGAGGAVTAAELAEGGADVLVLEQGPEHHADNFTARPPEMLTRLYREGGQTVTLGNAPVVLPLGRGLGGTTLINSGTCFRTPPRVLDRWRSEFGLELDPGELDRCFARVERNLSIAEVTPELAGANAAVIRRGAERLGWSHGYLRRNAKGCVGSGVCVYGCPTSAKQHTGITYIPKARAAGARIITGADVRRIRVSGGQVRGVQARTPDGSALDVQADRVIVTAGTIYTPVLLRASGLGSGSGQLGRNLTVHPATAALARMDEVVDMARGVPQSFFIDEFSDQGIMFETVAGPPSYVALSLPLVGRRHAEAMSAYRHLVQLGLMVSDGPAGSVHRVGRRAVVRYDLRREDLEKFRVGLGKLDEVLRAAGASEVFLPLPPGVRADQARRRHLHLMAFHPLGTARADHRPSHGVVDGRLAVHGVEGLYVADGSVCPSSLGVNPQLTIMALATKLAFDLLQKPCPS